MAERHAHAGPGTARALADIRTADRGARRQLADLDPCWVAGSILRASVGPPPNKRLKLAGGARSKGSGMS